MREAFEEARQCLKVGAYSACEMMCRKMIMYIAVEKGAQERDTLQSYLDHLQAQGYYITAPMKGWTGLITKHGNKATHRLEAPDSQRAESTFMFTVELLRLTYEMESMAQRYAPSAPSPCPIS